MRQMSKVNLNKYPQKRTQVAILLTDGHSNIDRTRTIKEAKLAHDDGITIIVIG